MSNRVLDSLALFSVVILSSAAPALAAGEILITQAKALAGNVTPGDAAGFPVTLSLPGAYEFGSNILPTAGQPGIRIAQRNVTIDLNGFELHGAGVAVHGITGLQPGATIRNGTIIGFVHDGINGTGESWIVENMRVVANGRYGIRVAGEHSSVRGSTVTENGDRGIYCDLGCFVEETTASGNGSVGIAIATGAVLGNVIIGNAGFGISSGGTTSTGYGSNILTFNNGGGAQVNVAIAELHSNACTPACL